MNQYLQMCLLMNLLIIMIKHLLELMKMLKAQIEDQTADDDEPSRVEKIVAYAPYYRKLLTTVAGASAYNYNKGRKI